MSLIKARLFARNEAGASLVEYALMIALIALVCIGAVAFIGTSAKKPYNSVGSTIGAAS